jgi:mRNA interferase HicA
LKREAFLKELDNSGCMLKRHGKRHDLYLNPKAGKVAPVPRHQEIRDTLYSLIRKQLGLVRK